MKLYLDTSVYSGYYDECHREFTKIMFDLINEKKIEVITSIFVHEELKMARDMRKKNSMSFAQ